MFTNFRNSLKIIIGSSLMLSANFFIQPHAAQAGNFSLTCKNLAVIKFGGPVYLMATCENSNHVSRRVTLTLAYSIANYDGTLAWAHNGGFDGSCNNFTITNYGAMSANCRTSAGDYRDSLIELDSKISNQNGVLVFDNF